MRKIIKIGIISILAIYICICFNPSFIRAEQKSKYGVIVQRDKDYAVYDNLIVKSPKNNLMIKVKDICELLDFTWNYNKDTKKLTIRCGEDKLTYKLGSKTYICSYASGDTEKITSAYPFYYDKVNKCYLVHYGTIGYLEYSCEYLKGSKGEYFSQKGYKGLVCYSENFMYDLYDAETDEMADDVIHEVISDDMDEFEKIVAIFDYMLLNYEYDDNYNNFNAYEILWEKKGVCQAYMEVFQLFMDKLGVECLSVVGEANNGSMTGSHGWNMVKLDGKYYHIDATWSDGNYYNNYEYFLLSDDQISANHFWSKKEYPKCTNKVDVDRSSIQEIVKDSYVYYIFKDNKLYFNEIKYDGTEKKNLAVLDISYQDYTYYQIEGDWLYYFSKYDSVSLCRLNLVTYEVEKIIDCDMLGLWQYTAVVHDEWAYLCKDNSFFRINMRTGERRDIFQLENNTMFIVDTNKFIYIYNHDEYYEFDYEGNLLRKSIDKD